MQTADVVVRLKTLEGRWHTCGVDRLRGVVPDPDSLVCDTDEWGPRSCGFILRRDPRAIHPDLAAFTPCKIEIGGVVVWAGRVRETPSRDGDDRQITVQGEGWQYHLDDDTYQWTYVHTNLADYRDMRSFIGANLALVRTAGSVSTDDGTVQIGWPRGTTLANTNTVGVMLDLGPVSTAKRIVMEWSSSANMSTDYGLFARGSDTDEPVQGTAINDAIFVSNPGAGTTSAGTFATARRYVALFLYYSGAGGSLASDVWVKIKAARVFADTAYESGNNSILQADDVVKDARDQATVLLSSSNDLIPTNDSIFNIPELALNGDQTPREVIQAVNAYEDNECAVDVERRLIFRNKVSRPVLEVGEWSGAEFSDASMNSGQEIYNRVIVQGEGPDGAPMRIERYTASLAGSPGFRISSPSNSNPSFDTNTTGWTTNASLTRDTTPGEFDTAPAGGRADVAAAGNYFVQSPAFSGTFLAGRTYRLDFWFSVDANITEATFKFGQASDVSTKVQPYTGVNTARHQIAWTPTADRTSVVLRVEYVTNAAAAIYIDTLELYEVRAAGTLVERQGFRRTKLLPVRSALTVNMANQIGDTFLRGHRVTPFKGDLTVTGQGGVRRGLGGAPVHPAHLLLEYGQQIRFSDRVNPDTGGWGRSGRIAAVSYKHADQQAAVSIDSQSGNLEALLSRLAVVTGQVR